VNTHQNLEQRGFAGAVFSHKAVDFPRLKFDNLVAVPVQRLCAGKILFYSFQDQRIFQSAPSSAYFQQPLPGLCPARALGIIL